MSDEHLDTVDRPSRFKDGRDIGPWGTTARAAVGLLGVVWAVAVPHPHPWLGLPAADSRLWGILLGAVAFPAVLTLIVLLRGRDASALQLGHGPAIAVTATWVVVLQIYPVVAMLAVAIPLLVQAVAGRCGCELLTIPNLLLRRNDYLFCLPFTPIDEWERRRRHA